MLSKAGVQCTMLPLFALLWNHAALAASDDVKKRAAELFEQGVRQFSGAQYDSAAKAFLAADALAPNAQALTNGITAARRAGLHLIVVEAAERALARADIDSRGATLAREALAEAARNLTRVEVTCAPSPCTLTLDGAEITPGARYVLPGTHDFGSSAPNGGTATQHLITVAGASYRVVLTPKAPERRTNERALPVARPRPVAPDPGVHSERKPLSPAVFYVGAAATAGLVGLTIWSGIDTLSAKSSATEATWDNVEHLARRTDIFLAGAVVLAGATAAVGLRFVEWGSDSYATAAVLPGGAAVAATGQF